MSKINHAHLFDSAKAYANIHPGKPRQADLRRSISTAYYGIFHYLINKSSSSLFKSQPLNMRIGFNRQYEHKVMSDTCLNFELNPITNQSLIKGDPKKAALYFGIGTQVQSGNDIIVVQPHSEIDNIASVFVSAKRLRHLADYDPLEVFNLQQALDLIDEIENAISDFEAISGTDEARFFLAMLYFGKFRQ